MRRFFACFALMKANLDSRCLTSMLNFCDGGSSVFSRFLWDEAGLSIAQFRVCEHSVYAPVFALI